MTAWAQQYSVTLKEKEVASIIKIHGSPKQVKNTVLFLKQGRGFTMFSNRLVGPRRHGTDKATSRD